MIQKLSQHSARNFIATDKSIELDGNNQVLMADFNSRLNFDNPDSFSITFTFTLQDGDVSGNSLKVLLSNSTNTLETGVLLGVSNYNDAVNRSLIARVYTGGSILFELVSNEKIQFDVSYFAAFVYDGATKNAKLYLGGRVVDEISSFAATSFASGIGWEVGRAFMNNDYCFKGTLSQVRMFDKVISQEEEKSINTWIGFVPDSAKGNVLAEWSIQNKVELPITPFHDDLIHRFEFIDSVGFVGSGIDEIIDTIGTVTGSQTNAVNRMTRQSVVTSSDSGAFGGNGWVELNPSISLTSACTVIEVSRNEGTGLGGYDLAQISSAEPNANSLSTRITDGTGIGVWAISTFTSVPVNSYSIKIFKRSSLGSVTHRYIDDSIDESDNVVGVFTGTINLQVIGATSADTTIAFPFSNPSQQNNDTFEILVFDSELSISDESNIINYLLSKYTLGQANVGSLNGGGANRFLYGSEFNYNYFNSNVYSNQINLKALGFSDKSLGIDFPKSNESLKGFYDGYSLNSGGIQIRTEDFLFVDATKNASGTWLITDQIQNSLGQDLTVYTIENNAGGSFGILRISFLSKNNVDIGDVITNVTQGITSTSTSRSNNGSNVFRRDDFFPQVLSIGSDFTIIFEFKTPKYDPSMAGFDFFGNTLNSTSSFSLWCGNNSSQSGFQIGDTTSFTFLNLPSLFGSSLNADYRYIILLTYESQNVVLSLYDGETKTIIESTSTTLSNPWNVAAPLGFRRMYIASFASDTYTGKRVNLLRSIWLDDSNLGLVISDFERRWDEDDFNGNVVFKTTFSGIDTNRSILTGESVNSVEFDFLHRINSRIIIPSPKSLINNTTKIGGGLLVDDNGFPEHKQALDLFTDSFRWIRVEDYDHNTQNDVTSVFMVRRNSEVAFSLDNVLLYKNNIADANDRIFYYFESGAFEFVNHLMQNNGGGGIYMSNPTEIDPQVNDLSMFTFQHNESKARIFVNGNVYSEEDLPLQLTAPYLKFSDLDDDLRLFSNLTNRFNGYAIGVYLFKRILRQDEILDLYNNSTFNTVPKYLQSDLTIAYNFNEGSFYESTNNTDLRIKNWAVYTDTSEALADGKSLGDRKSKWDGYVEGLAGVSSLDKLTEIQKYFVDINLLR